MKTVLTAALALLILPGAGLYAQDFIGPDVREALNNARQELAAGAVQPEIEADRTDFGADAAPAAAQKEWTIMVFINGKNNLEGEGLSDINEMELVGSDGNINIVAEMGHYSSDKVYRFLVSKDTDTEKISSPVLGSASGVDMGDPAAVKNFTLWAERRFPAKKYMLILWDHGSGWLKGNPVQERSEAKGISDDWKTGHNIDTPQLGRLVADIEAAGGRVDLLAMDACLMQMMEVAYELKDTRISHIAASQEIEPGAGYTYNKWLAPLAAKPSMTPAQLGVTVAQEYLKANPDGFMGIGLTYSVLEVARVAPLAVKMDAMAKAAMAANDKAAVLRARAEATRYSLTDSKDLRRFAQLLMQHSANAEVKAAAAGVERFMAGNEGPVVFNGVSVNRPTLSHGVAVYVPENAEEIRGYNELKMSADTSWDEFVTWLLAP